MFCVIDIVKTANSCDRGRLQQACIFGGELASPTIRLCATESTTRPLISDKLMDGRKIKKE